MQNRPLEELQRDFIYPIDDFVFAKSSQSGKHHRSRIEDVIESLATEHPRWPITVC
jgi:hypothetical protein